MAHDTHFLSRLERVEGPALNLALGLYRDSPQLKWALARLDIPDEAEVVALPLDAGETPPYAMVSRRGKFITCLGAGMRPTHAEVVGWAQLERATGELQAWREVRAKGEARGLAVQQRMVGVGPWLSREDFEDLQVVASINPLVVLKLQDRLIANYRAFDAAYHPRDFRKLTSAHKDLLSKAWRYRWGAAHGMVVINESILHLDVLRPGFMIPEAAVERALTGFSLGLDGTLVRGGWMLGRLGERALPFIEAWLRFGVQVVAERHIPTNPDRQRAVAGSIVGLYGLLAMATRFPGLEPTIRGLLESLISPDQVRAVQGMSPDDAANLIVASNFIAGMVAACLCHLDEAASGHPTSQAELNRLALYFYQGIPETREGSTYPVGPPLRPGVPLRRALPPGEPMDRLVQLAPFGLHASFQANPVLWMDRLHLMPGLGAVDPEDLFFPAQTLAALGQEHILTTPVELVRDLMDLDKGATVAHRPVRRAPVPDRNSPCPCGSGKKYKKCCGA